MKFSFKSGMVMGNTTISHNLPVNEADKGFELVEKKLDQSLKILIHFN